MKREYVVSVQMSVVVCAETAAHAEQIVTDSIMNMEVDETCVKSFNSTIKVVDNCTTV